MRVPARFDHLMYGGGLGLEPLIEHTRACTGATATFGGRHDTGGTHNALIGLGPDQYLELIAADPEGDANAERGRLVAGLPGPRNIAWAIAVEDLDATVASARAAGYDPGPIQPLRRRRPDGTWLAWRLAWASSEVFLGVVPFLIEWGAARHPAADLPAAGALIDLRAEHPEPERIRPILAALTVDLDLRPGPQPALIASFEGPAGVIELK